MKVCRLCRVPALAGWLDLGPQPVSNRFLRSPDELEYVHPIALGHCRACGTVQLAEPMPAEEVRPRFDWINYNEPEGHLDQLADELRRLPGLTAQSTACGVSYKDESCLRRLRERGLARTWVPDLRKDLGVTAPGAGIESVQDSLTPEKTALLAQRHGRPDLVLVRHVLEHSHDLHGLLTALRQLVAPGGYLVFEVPDARRALEKCDYSTIWEEHVFYFTPATLRNCFALTGFDLVAFRRFPYTLEDSLVAVVRSTEEPAEPCLVGRDLEEETRRARDFASRFPARRQRYLHYFESFRREHGRVAFLGAGHLTCALVNYFDLAHLIDFVVDDNPHKKGLYMPGSRLPIRGSEALLDGSVQLCCMSVRPEVEDRVVANNQPFRARGGRMASIFPDSPYALAV